MGLEISILRHAGAIHVAGNLVGAMFFAPRVVRALGWLPALLLAIGAGELANRGAAVLIDRPVIGASASVFALAGAWLVLFPCDRNARASIVLLLALQAAMAAVSLDFGGVAWVAHLIGATLGAASVAVAGRLGVLGRVRRLR